MEQLNIAVASMNQTPLAWTDNLLNIIKAIQKCSNDSHLLLTPEMSITGYDMEDQFLSHDAFHRAMSSVFSLINKLKQLSSQLHVIVGAPLMMPSGQIYNGSYWISKAGLLGVALKPNLAGEGLHYEDRWFKPWPQGQRTTLRYKDIFGDLCTSGTDFNESDRIVPIGDMLFDLSGVSVGIESCEAAFAVNRPAIAFYKQGVDLILNPSASHMAVEPDYDKQKIREGVVTSASRSLGVVYAYANLQGCSGGRTIYDGGNMIASAGDIIATGPRLSFKDVDVIKATVDIRANRTLRSMQSEIIQSITDRIHVGDALSLAYIEPKRDIDDIRLNKMSDIHRGYALMSKGVALGLWDWGQKTNIGKYALSLSGGADSSICAALLYLAHSHALDELGVDRYLIKLASIGIAINNPSDIKEDLVKHVMSEVLVTAYQKTDNNSSATESAAERLSKSIGAKFHSLNIQGLVDTYQSVFNDTQENPLSWDNHSDDITMQNLQARIRNPLIWMFANRENRLLITTSNKSENAVGYYTQDGDSAGVLAPIAGISKSHIIGNPEKEGQVGLMSFLHHDQITLRSGVIVRIDGLDEVLALKPSAELRQLNDNQKDEDDLMPFPILDEIEDWHQISRLPPKEILQRVHQSRKDRYSLSQMASMVDRYISLFVRSEWKRTKNAVGFHIERNSLDPKTYSRFPLLSGALKDELRSMWDYVAEQEKAVNRM